MNEPRYRRARELAGLSLGQAAKLLGITRDSLVIIEACPRAQSPTVNVAAMADVYGVNVEWLTGEREQYDFAAVDRMIICGVDKDGITPKDRETLAEFAASIPRKKAKTLADIRKEKAGG